MSRYTVQWFDNPNPPGPGIKGTGWIVMDNLTGYPMGAPVTSQEDARHEAIRLNNIEWENAPPVDYRPWKYSYNEMMEAFVPPKREPDAVLEIKIIIDELGQSHTSFVTRGTFNGQEGKELRSYGRESDMREDVRNHLENLIHRAKQEKGLEPSP